MSDPIERIVADGLKQAGISYVIDGKADTLGLDFFLPEAGIYIECKQFHTNRVSEQMSRAPDVIVVQGRRAAEWFAQSLRTLPSPPSSAEEEATRSAEESSERAAS